MKKDKATLVSQDEIAQSIIVLRGHKVLLDSDLAAIYEVETRSLVQAVKRNIDRFPRDFMFQLTWEEAKTLRSQSAIADSPASRSQTVILKRGANVKYQPYAFTEQGVAMLSSVLRSPRAIAVNIEIMRAFVRMRGVLASNKALARKLDELESKVQTHDDAITAILSAIRELMTPPETENKRRIGFINDE